VRAGVDEYGGGLDSTSYVSTHAKNQKDEMIGRVVGVRGYNIICSLARTDDEVLEGVVLCRSL